MTSRIWWLCHVRIDWFCKSGFIIHKNALLNRIALLPVRSQIDLKVPRKLIDVTNISIRKIRSQNQSIPSQRYCSWFVTDHSRRGTATKTRVPKKGSGLGKRMSRATAGLDNWLVCWVLPKQYYEGDLKSNSSVQLTQFKRVPQLMANLGDSETIWHSCETWKQYGILGTLGNNMAYLRFRTIECEMKK